MVANTERGERVQAGVRVSGGDDVHGELASLTDWLDNEPELRGRFRFERPDPEPGHMGVGTDVLIVALSGGGAVTALARSLSVWLKQRRADVSVEVTGVDGRQVTINALRIADPETIIREVLTELDGDS